MSDIKIYFYKIENKKNRRVYIGQTRDFKKRIATHKYLLKIGIHSSKKLQFDYDQYGEDNFNFEIIDTLTGAIGIRIREKENSLFKEYNSKINGYNHINDVFNANINFVSEIYSGKVGGDEHLKLRTYLLENQIPKSEFTKQAILEKIERDDIN